MSRPGSSSSGRSPREQACICGARAAVRPPWSPRSGPTPRAPRCSAGSRPTPSPGAVIIVWAVDLAYDRAVFEVGDIVAGKYRVERELGRGGMGMVVAATHIHL